MTWAGAAGHLNLRERDLPAGGMKPASLGTGTGRVVMAQLGSRPRHFHHYEDKGAFSCQILPTTKSNPMSHFTEIKTQIKDIEALRYACQEMGLPLL